ncbi:MAG: GNAT family N-acetyltransferase [Pelosinus sp.]|nr:GNAT family N-acetyltransferase [Pelosinus sp.]
MSKSYQSLSSCLETESEESIKISIAKRSEEKREIYHFRYEIYVEEMSKQLTEADHTNKLLYDDLDEQGLLLCAKVGSKIIATARINIGPVTNFPPILISQLSLDVFQNHKNSLNFSYCSKLMVAPSYRNSAAVYLLIAKCYELSYANNVSFVFVICNFHLIRFYEKMGFHRFGGNYFIPGYGLMTPLVFSMDDIQHLRVIRSPLFRIARKNNSPNLQKANWFHEKFVSASHIINSQLVTKDELWSTLCNRLGFMPTKGITLLKSLSVEEAKNFLHCCGTIVQCNPGNIVTKQSNISYSYDTLISGKLRSLTFINPVKEYAISGQHFGANGLTEHELHNETIETVDTSEILVLSGINFRKFLYSNLDAAHKIIRTIHG